MVIIRAERGNVKENGVAVLAGGRLPPLRNENENRDLPFSHHNKMNPVNGMNFVCSQGFIYAT